MRGAIPQIIVGVILVIAGWLLGQHFGTSTVLPSQPIGNSADERGVSGGERPSNERADVPKPMTVTDFRAAAEQLPYDSGAGKFSALFRLAQRLAPEDFPDAINAIRELERGSGEPGELLGIWAERDLKAAKAWFEAQPIEWQAKLFSAWANTWVRLDADGLRRWLSTRSESDRKSLNRPAEYLTVLAKLDPAATFELARLYPQMQVEEEFDSYAFKATRIEVLEMWAKRNPEAAAAKALELPKGKEQSEAISAVIGPWAAREPEAALAWIDGLSDPALQKEAQGRFLIAIAWKDAAAAMEFIRSRMPAEEQARFLRTLGFVGEPDGVLKLAREQTDLETRRAMLSSALGYMPMAAGLSSWAGGAKPEWWDKAMDPQRAAKIWIEESTVLGAPLDGAGDTAAALARQQGLPAALAFLERIPPAFADAAKGAPEAIAKVRGWQEVAEAAVQMPAGARRADWIEKAITAMIKNGDASAAQRIVERLPRGPERDNALRIMEATPTP